MARDIVLEMLEQECPYDMELKDYVEQKSPETYDSIKGFNDGMKSEYERYWKADKLAHDKYESLVKELGDDMFKL